MRATTLYARKRLSIFGHLLNKMKLFLVMRLFNFPCPYIQKNLNFLKASSVLLNEVRDTFIDKYDVELLFEQDRDAVLSRIMYVQNHETPMREGWQS